MADEIGTPATAPAQIKSGIYEIVNRVNGKRYVGSAVNLHKRWLVHQRHLRKGAHGNVHLQRAWNKYHNHFVFLILERCDRPRLIEREQHYIDTLRPEFNVLLIAGSLLGFRHSGASRVKMSAAAIGKKLSAETRAKISAAQRRKSVSVETRAKMSAARQGMKFTAEHRANLSAARKGKKNSAETRAKLSAINAGREISAEHRAKLSAAFAGRKFSAETRAKMSAAKLGIGFMLGKKHSPETRAKMSRSAKARCERAALSD